jgi:DNA repair exonuclease SbcCD ATPase subunit
MTDETSTSAGSNGATAGERSAEEVHRHEAHLVGQVYHLIEANRKLEEQLDRLAKVTEIADIFRQRKISQDTFDLAAPELFVPPEVQNAWSRLEAFLADLPDETEGLQDLREALGIVRTKGWQVDHDWLSDVRVRLLAAEQAIAFLDEQSRELDQLREEKLSIMDGVERLEQTIEDLWKSLNEKTTHIQRIETQLHRVWGSAAYRFYRWCLKLLRRGGGDETS